MSQRFLKAQRYPGDSTASSSGTAHAWTQFYAWAHLWHSLEDNMAVTMLPRNCSVKRSDYSGFRSEESNATAHRAMV